MSKRGKEKNLKIPLWVRDGTNGILGLVIYNFLLYLLTISNSQNFLKNMQDTTGSFYITTFSTLGINLTISTIFIFAFAFLLGVLVAKQVRKKY